MKRKQVIILVVLVVLSIGVFFGVKGVQTYNDLRAYQKQVSDITISNVNIAKVADGTYFGSYEVTWVAAEVKIVVKNHRIERIDLLKHKNGRGAPAEIIPSRVIEAQSLQVDTVSGATSSSKVILKAIEKALNSAVK